MFKTNYLLMLYLTLLTSVLYAQTENEIKQKINRVLSATQIEFIGNSMVLTSQSKMFLLKTAKLLKKYPKYHYKITGYANSREDEKFNEILSKNRAIQVKNILIAEGLDSNIFSVEGVVGLTVKKKADRRRQIPISFIDFEMTDPSKRQPISQNNSTIYTQKTIASKKQLILSKRKLSKKEGDKRGNSKSLEDYLILRKKENSVNQKKQNLASQKARERQIQQKKNDLNTQISKSRLNVFFSMNQILFNENGTLLTKKAKEILYKTAEFMLYYPNFKFNIIGQTDKSLHETNNKNLDKKRAEVVKDYLVNIEKVNPSNLFIIEKRDKKLVANNMTKQERASSHRVVFSIAE